MKVSMVVPVYNVEKYLDRCIKSILNQKYQDMEIILINDGSTDNSLAICEKYREQDSRIIIINKANQGLSAARNDGVEVASGEYIMFIDSDDYIDDSLVSEAVEIMQKEDVDLVRFNFCKEGKVFRRTNKYLLPVNCVLDSLGEEVKKNIFETDNLSNCWVTLFKSSIVKGMKFDTDVKFAEDLLFMAEYLKLAKKIYISDKCYYHYIINPKGLTLNFDIKKSILKSADSIKVNARVEDLIFEGVPFEVNPRLEKSIKKINSFVNLCIENCNYKKFKEIMGEYKNNPIIKEELDKLNNFNLDMNYSTYLIKKIKLCIKRILRKIL